MKVMKYSILYLLLLAFTFASCASEDEDLTPSHADRNLFAPSDDDQSETAEIEREFYKKNGCYILFNDTLSNEPNGTDAKGDTLWNTQLIDVNYPVIGSVASSYEYTYKYVKDATIQRKAAEYIGEQLADKLGKNCPYSFLVVDSVYAWTYSNGVRTLVTPNAATGATPYPTNVQGNRCIVVSIHDKEMFENPNYLLGIIQGMAYKKIQNMNQSLLDEFYSYSKNYYSVRKNNLGYPMGTGQDDAARKFGFWKDHNYFYFGVTYFDVKNFSNAACEYSLAEVEDMMKDYPLVIAKFKVMRDLLISMGFDLK